MKYGAMVLLGWCLMAANAQAFTKYDDYRFSGREIVAATASGPSEIEGPASLEIKLRDVDEVLKLESDNETESCADTLNSMAGSEFGYVQVLVNENASTMNGLLILHCTPHYLH